MNATSQLISATELYASRTEAGNRWIVAFTAREAGFLPVVQKRRGGGSVPWTPDERLAHFLARIQRAEVGCWLFLGGCTPDGYGLISLGRLPDGRQTNDYAHRVAFKLFVGPIPDGLVVRHSCDNPPCCNPNHLLLGTQAENIADAQRQGKYCGDRPSQWTIDISLRRALVAEALDAPRGTIKRLAREHGVSFRMLYMAVKRARLTRAA